MAMEQVKQRDFILKFSQYRDREIQIVNKNEIIGVFSPADLLTKGDIGIPASGEDGRGEPKEFVNKSEKEEKFQELKERIEVHAKWTSGVMSKLDEEILADISPTDTSAITAECQRCKNFTPDLWTLWEDGKEYDVCRNCIAVNFPSRSHLEAYLRTLVKVQMLPKSGETITVRSARCIPNSFSHEFNPLPKPVKEKKKKTF